MCQLQKWVPWSPMISSSSKFIENVGLDKIYNSFRITSLYGLNLYPLRNIIKDKKNITKAKRKGKRTLKLVLQTLNISQISKGY